MNTGQGAPAPSVDSAVLLRKTALLYDHTAFAQIAAVVNAALPGCFPVGKTRCPESGWSRLLRRPWADYFRSTVTGYAACSVPGNA